MTDVRKLNSAMGRGTLRFWRLRKLDAIEAQLSEWQVYGVNTFPRDDEKANHRERRDSGGRSESMQNNKRPVGHADEGVIFKFNSAVPRDKRVMVPPPTLCAPTVYFTVKNSGVLFRFWWCTTNDRHD